MRDPCACEERARRIEELEARVQELETAAFPLAFAGRSLELSGRTPGTVLIHVEHALRAAEILFKEGS